MFLRGADRLSNQHHLPDLDVPFCLEPVDIHPGRQPRWSPSHGMLACDKGFLHQPRDPLSSHVVDVQKDHRFPRNIEADLSLWIEGIGVILVQGELRRERRTDRHLSRTLQTSRYFRTPGRIRRMRPRDLPQPGLLL